MRDEVNLYPVKIEKVFTSLSEAIDWGLSKFKIPELWKTSRGKDVVVGVIDTGWPNHQDIGDNAIKGKNFTSDESIEDKNGHQTHCVGIISAKNNNAGVVGVAPDSKCLCVKALNDSGSGSNLGIARAIHYCIDSKVDIINMSLGSTIPSFEVRSAVKRAYDNNIPVVCAAGNIGESGVNYPAAFDECIAVGAFNKLNKIADFSSKGMELDIAAPGVDILSTYSQNSYAVLSGTSMACPFVSGVLALLISKFKAQGIPYTIDDIKKIILTEADDMGDEGLDASWGYGMIDPDGMIINAPELDPNLPILPNPDKSKPKWFKSKMSLITSILIAFSILVYFIL